MIQLKGIHKSYKTDYTSLHVLKGIDLTFHEGEFVSIMGSSGSGKSTLLNILGILDEYDEGEYLLGDELIGKDLDETRAAYFRNKFMSLPKCSAINNSITFSTYPCIIWIIDILVKFI